MTTSHADQEPAMSRQRDVQEHDRRTASHDPRQRLLAAIPVTERRLRVAGVSTAVLEGGDGPPIVLLHSSGEFAALWMRVIPNLVTTHRVVAPDLPGHGASEVTDGPLDVDHMVRWLDALIERTCQSPPALVGHGLGGAIAAHFAIAHADRLSGLVLVDAFGLDRFEPAPSFGLALHRFMEQPTEHTRDGLFQQCFVDLDGLRQQLGGRWEPLAAYALDRARTPGQQGALGSLMPQLGLPTIPPADLARISVPTTLIWGRQDLQVRLQVAEAASARHGWPLHVIENAGDDPPFEQPEAFLRALHAARLSESRGVRMSTQAYKDAVELAVDRWNAHDERYFEAYTEDASMHGFPANVPPTVEGIRALFGAMWAAFPDIRVEIEHLGVEDDVAALHFRVRGTHAGEFMGAAPTGNRIDVEVMTFLRFGPEGKIVERWNRMDEVGMMTQLGLMPAPA